MLELVIQRLRIAKRKLFFGKQFIADIGAGHNPSVFASLVIEKFIENDTHRQGQAMELSSSVILQADIENIPLRDKCIDFSICSHVLEHVTNPAEAIKEISRISKGGYVELPNKLSEYVFDREDHLWVCTLREDGSVLMEPKSLKFEKEFSSLFKTIIMNNHNNWYKFYFSTFYEWNICLRWAGSLPILVTGQPQKMPSELTQSARLKDYSAMSRIENLFKKLLRKINFQKNQMDIVISNMQCNQCYSSFHQQDLELSCKCGVQYKIDGNILRSCNE